MAKNEEARATSLAKYRLTSLHPANKPSKTQQNTQQKQQIILGTPCAIKK